VSATSESSRSRSEKEVNQMTLFLLKLLSVALSASLLAKLCLSCSD